MVCKFAVFCFIAAARSVALPATSTTTAQLSESTACGDIINAVESTSASVFNASLAFECLVSVPFNAAVATRFLQYYNDTLQFQSTLAYLKDPPSSYQQQGVDLLGGLNLLQQGIDSGAFSNQYTFEAALQTLLCATHDGHVNLYAGILDAFSFASPYDVVSVSVDGIQMPNVYIAIDIVDSHEFTRYQPSPITAINGEDVITYLERFASQNSVGLVEPHADWNALMFSYAQEIQGYMDVFSGGATFYPGDTITFLLENGTVLTDNFLAIYNDPGPTGALETGGDFYNFFVLGFYPASYVVEYTDDTGIGGSTVSNASTISGTGTTSTITATSSLTISSSTSSLSWYSPAYPALPDVVQPDLGLYGGGYVSGYFLNVSSVSVLSIPSFDEYGVALNTFHNTVTEFLINSRAAGLTKIVIDLQQNTGGQVLLALDTFKQFFPDIDPYAGSRMRAHDSANVMGETITGYFDTLNDTQEDYFLLVGNEWLSSDRINADTGNEFSSWAEFYGPHLYHGDNFTTTQRYNLSDVLFSLASTSGDDNVDDSEELFLVYGYGEEAATSLTPPYAASDIIILSDAICDSSCALFMELMHHEAGVRVVVVGGRPEAGPMQAPSGSRGARSYTTDVLDIAIDYTQKILASQQSPAVNFLPNRTEALDVYVTLAELNLRDQVRRNETIPLQFAYEAADCRIFFTPKTVFNYTALWQYSADAMWKNSSLCVTNSTGYATTGTNKTDFTGPAPAASVQITNITAYLVALNESTYSQLADLTDPLVDVGSRSSQASYVACGTGRTCPSGSACYSYNRCVNSKVEAVAQCLDTCNVANKPCGAGGSCRLKAATNFKVGSSSVSTGYCMPSLTSQMCGAGYQLNSKVVVAGSPSGLLAK